MTFPVASADFLEQYEGMLVRLPQTMYVTEHFQLGRFGAGACSRPAAGSSSRRTSSRPARRRSRCRRANNLNRIILDDASQAQNPDPILFARGGLPLSASNTLRGGDTATGIVGVMTYTWAGNSASGNAYRVRPINALGGYVNFEPTNPRPTSAPDVGGTLKVVGHEPAQLLQHVRRPARQRRQLHERRRRRADRLPRRRHARPSSTASGRRPSRRSSAMDADVVGFNEIENDGYGPDSAIAFLVDQLNAATAPGTYAFIDADAGDRPGQRARQRRDQGRR